MEEDESRLLYDELKDDRITKFLQRLDKVLSWMSILVSRRLIEKKYKSSLVGPSLDLRIFLELEVCVCMYLMFVCMCKGELSTCQVSSSRPI